MESSAQVFWLPKAGNSSEEYEDAYSYSNDERQFAVADGATESSYADIWALSLANQYTTRAPDGTPPTGEAMTQWLKPLQQQWSAQINWDQLPWYAEEKARKGAFATMLGMKFIYVPGEEPTFFQRMMGKKARKAETRWQAVAVGDSNFYQIRNDALVHAFPLEKAEQFNSRPMLLSSNPNRNTYVWNEMRNAEGVCEASDVFYMATDALAKWFLDQREKGQKPWQVLAKVKTESDFANLVGELRKKQGMRNDDTTLLAFRPPVFPEAQSAK